MICLKNGSFAGFACFDSTGANTLLLSGRSALTSGGGRYPTAATLIQMQGNAGAFEIMKAVAHAGFNTEADDDGTSYARSVTGNINTIMDHIKCSKP